MDNNRLIERVTVMKIGLIGLGNMGGRIAKRLLDMGHELSVYDVNHDAIEQFTKLGAIASVTPAVLAERNDFVITVLPNARIVKRVTLGEEGLIHGLKAGSTLIDMTTSVPEVTVEIYKELKKQSVNMLDAPVSGGVKKAEDGSLSIMVGGEESVFAQSLSLLKDIGTTITHVGEIGSGHTIKVLNNILCATTLAATAEVLAVGKKMGLDPEKMLEVINTSSGRSHSSEVKFPQQILSRKFEVGFTVDLMCKDVNIAIDMAKNNNIPVPISSTVSQLWQDALSNDFGDKDHTAIAKYIEEMANVEIKA
jgi:3-hydroxyisobutyrate dehydrogenase